MSDFSEVSTAALLTELRGRQSELLDDQGMLVDGAYELADFMSIRVCVDGAPARINEDGETEMMAILRNTGRYAGKLCLVGGGVGRVKQSGEWVPESIEQALRRHFATDLGYEINPLEGWDKPHFVAQDMRPDADGNILPGFMPNFASRHLIAVRFIVGLENVGNAGPVFGSTERGGQEAAGVQWFTQEQMPSADSFGYNHGVTYDAMFPTAQRLLTPQ